MSDRQILFVGYLLDETNFSNIFSIDENKDYIRLIISLFDLKTSLVIDLNPVDLLVFVVLFVS